MSENDEMVRKISDLELRLARLEAIVDQRVEVSNCPKCHAKYRGPAPSGKRTCPMGCGYKGTF